MQKVGQSILCNHSTYCHYEWTTLLTFFATRFEYLEILLFGVSFPFALFIASASIHVLMWKINSQLERIIFSSLYRTVVCLWRCPTCIGEVSSFIQS